MARALGLEFYKTPNGDVLYKRAGESVSPLSPGDSLVEELITVIRERYPEATKALSELYSQSIKNPRYFTWQIVSRFIRCNFGEYNCQTIDVDFTGLFNFEEVSCPLRGECRWEGIICKPTLTTTLTPREVEVAKLIKAGLKTSQIAEQLFISEHTVHRHRENIKAKIQANTMADIATYVTNNLKD